MSKPEVLIQAVVVEGLSYGQVAARYGVSKTLVHRLHHRWLIEGDTAFLPRSSRPASSPNQTPADVAARILQVRDQLTAAGLDAGADTIHAHLDTGSVRPSRATIWRILSRAGTITPQPQKRPRSSFIRFAAERPNQTWQSDFTHCHPDPQPRRDHHQPRRHRPRRLHDQPETDLPPQNENGRTPETGGSLPSVLIHHTVPPEGLEPDSQSSNEQPLYRKRPNFQRIRYRKILMKSPDIRSN